MTILWRGRAKTYFRDEFCAIAFFLCEEKSHLHFPLAHTRQSWSRELTIVLLSRAHQEIVLKNHPKVSSSHSSEIRKCEKIALRPPPLSANSPSVKKWALEVEHENFPDFHRHERNKVSKIYTFQLFLNNSLTFHLARSRRGWSVSSVIAIRSVLFFYSILSWVGKYFNFPQREEAAARKFILDFHLSNAHISRVWRLSAEFFAYCVRCVHIDIGENSPHTLSAAH